MKIKEQTRKLAAGCTWVRQGKADVVWIWFSKSINLFLGGWDIISTIGIVSLSSGIIGEDFVKHEVDLGVQRLKDLGLNPIFLPHSLKGLDFIKDHPEARAEDLMQAFSDDSIDMILCAIGGDDTYRLLPYLLKMTNYKSLSNKRFFLVSRIQPWTISCCIN